MVNPRAIPPRPLGTRHGRLALPILRVPNALTWLAPWGIWTSRDDPWNVTHRIRSLTQKRCTGLQRKMLSIYIYICICIYIYVYVYIYIYFFMCVWLYVYIYIYKQLDEHNISFNIVRTSRERWWPGTEPSFHVPIVQEELRARASLFRKTPRISLSLLTPEEPRILCKCSETKPLKLRIHLHKHWYWQYHPILY